MRGDFSGCAETWLRRPALLAILLTIGAPGWVRQSAILRVAGFEFFGSYFRRYVGTPMMQRNNELEIKVISSGKLCGTIRRDPCSIKISGIFCAAVEFDLVPSALTSFHLFYPWAGIAAVVVRVLGWG